MTYIVNLIGKTNVKNFINPIGFIKESQEANMFVLAMGLMLNVFFIDACHVLCLE